MAIYWFKSDRKGGTVSDVCASGRGYAIFRKRDGTFFVEARMVGGQLIRLPFKSFTSMDEAKAHCEELEEAHDLAILAREKDQEIRF